MFTILLNYLIYLDSWCRNNRNNRGKINNFSHEMVTDGGSGKPKFHFLTCGSVYGTMAPKLQRISVSRIDKLIQKALVAPQNLRFTELCTLCEYFGMELRNKKGSHMTYRRKLPPVFTLSIQDDDGKAKPYQARQLLDKVREHGLYDFQEEE